MIQVDNKIISLDVFEKHFICDLNACKGACCVDGDAGAPLLEKEVFSCTGVLVIFGMDQRRIFTLYSQTNNPEIRSIGKK